MTGLGRSCDIGLAVRCCRDCWMLHCSLGHLKEVGHEYNLHLGMAGCDGSHHYHRQNIGTESYLPKSDPENDLDLSLSLMAGSSSVGRSRCRSTSSGNCFGCNRNRSKACYEIHRLGHCLVVRPHLLQSYGRWNCRVLMSCLMVYYHLPKDCPLGQQRLNCWIRRD